MTIVNWQCLLLALVMMDLHLLASSTPAKSSHRDLGCISPYELIGGQCLFFSRPYAAWSLDEGWSESYLNYYDAVAFCRGHNGELATHVADLFAAVTHCQKLRGTCAKSLISRSGDCFEWSPIDGSEVQVPCNSWEITRRFICEMKKFSH